jgi:hypothetical protein
MRMFLWFILVGIFIYGFMSYDIRAISLGGLGIILLTIISATEYIVKQIKILQGVK